jgi:hypothetical protein
VFIGVIVVDTFVFGLNRVTVGLAIVAPPVLSPPRKYALPSGKATAQAYLRFGRPRLRLATVCGVALGFINWVPPKVV